MMFRFDHEFHFDHRQEPTRDQLCFASIGSVHFVIELMQLAGLVFPVATETRARYALIETALFMLEAGHSEEFVLEFVQKMHHARTLMQKQLETAYEAFNE